MNPPLFSFSPLTIFSRQKKQQTSSIDHFAADILRAIIAMSQNYISTTAPSTTLSADSGNPPISPTPTRAKTFPSMRPSRASVAQGPSSGRIDLGTVYLGFYTRLDPKMPAEVQNGDEWTLVSLKKQLKPGSQELEAGTQILVNSIASSRCDLKSTYDDHKKPKPSLRKKWCWKLESDGKSFEVFPQDEDEGATMQSVANIIGIDQASMARFWIKAKMCLGEETEDPTALRRPTLIDGSKKARSLPNPCQGVLLQSRWGPDRSQPQMCRRRWPAVRPILRGRTASVQKFQCKMQTRSWVWAALGQPKDSNQISLRMPVKKSRCRL